LSSSSSSSSSSSDDGEHPLMKNTLSTPVSFDIDEEDDYNYDGDTNSLSSPGSGSTISSTSGDSNSSSSSSSTTSSAFSSAARPSSMKASNYLAVEHDVPNNGKTTTTSKQRFVLRRLSSRSSTLIKLKIPGRKPRRTSSKQQPTQQRQQQQQQRRVVFADNVTVRIVPSMLDLLLQNDETIRSSAAVRFYQSKLWYQSQEYTAMKANIHWLVRGLQQGSIPQTNNEYCLRGLEKQLGITNIVDQQPVRVRPEHDFSISSSAARPVVQHVLREQTRQGTLAVILASSASTSTTSFRPRRRGKRQRRNSNNTSTTTKCNNNNNDIDVVRLSKISRMITAKDTDEALKRGRIDEQLVVVAAAVRSRSHMVSI